MLHILLVIFKIIGIALLCILALFLFLLLIVLFVPVRYKARASKYDETNVTVAVSWLLRSLFIRAKYMGEKGTFYYAVRLFGIPIIDSRQPKKIKKVKNKKVRVKKTQKTKKTKNSKSSNKKNKNNSVNDEITGIEFTDKQLIEHEIEDKKTSLEHEGDIQSSHNKIVSSKRNVEVDIQGVENSGRKNFQDEVQEKTDQEDEDLVQDYNLKESFIHRSIIKIRCIINKIKNFFHSIKERIKKIKQSILNTRKKFSNIKYRIHLIKEFLTDEKNKDGIQCTFASIKKAIKHILPYKIKGEVKVGFEDPCNTGYLIGALSIIYPLYENHLKVVPDFQEEVLEGKIVAMGRIRAFTLLKIGIKMMLDKKFKTLIKNVKELKEEL